jgi:pSer/pThr/pTyr-binding forkhead associated (FHA) protein|nr:MAG: ABC transporter ATP-binding protein [Sphaerobacter thermophilus]
MMASLPFEWFLLLLRVVFIFLLYFFLFQVIRVILREMQSYARGSQAVRAAEPSGHLIVKAPGNSGLRPGARLELEPVTVIGRHPRATIRIDDSFVSGEHAQVTWTEDGWWVTDLGSTNGTRVNGKRVMVPTGLRYGDVIQIGDVELQLAP